MPVRNLWLRTIEDQHAEDFIGRVEQLSVFRDGLSAYPPRYLITYISGQGGVGKTQLLKQYQRIARAQGFVVIESDEQRGDIPGILDKFAAQLAMAGLRLKQFEQKMKRYRELRQEIEGEIEPPVNWANTLGRITARIGLALADEVPVVRQSKKFVEQDVIEDYAGGLTGYLARKLGNKHDEVELMTRPAVVLSKEFFENLHTVATDRKLLLCFDNYEFTQAYLDPWFAALLHDYDLPDGLRLAIAGRTVPDRVGYWEELIKITLYVSLDVFSETEANLYLDQQAIFDTSRRQEILNLSGRLPILLSLLASEAEGITLFGFDTTSSVVDRYLRWIDDPARREIALHAAIPRFIDEQIVVVLAPFDQNPKTLFEWLRQRPFIFKRDGGVKRDGRWQYHSVVRQLFARYLRERGDHYRKLHEQSADYYDARCKSIANEDPKWESPEWVRAAFDRTYHRLISAPHIQWPLLLGSISANLSYLPQYGVLVQEFVQDPLLEKELSPSQLEDLSLIASSLKEVHVNGWRAGLPLLDRLGELSSLFLDKAHYVYHMRGQVHRNLGSFDSAMADFDHVLARNPKDVSCLFEKGVTYRYLDRFDDALQFMGKVLELAPDTTWAINAWEEMGHVQSALGNNVKGLELFTAVLHADPERFWIHLDLAELHAETEDYEASLVHIDGFLRCVPNDAYALTRRADILLAVGRYKEAIEVLHGVLKNSPRYADAHGALCVAYRSVLNFEAAMNHINIALEVEPDWPWFLLQRGSLFRALGDHESALADYNQLIERSPEDTSALADRAMTYADLGQYDEALADLESYQALSPNSAWGWVLRAEILRRVGDHAAALDAIERCLEIDPTRKTAFVHRGKIHFICGEYEMALADYNKALDLDSTDSFALMNRGWLRFTQRDYGLAVDDLLPVIEQGLKNAYGLAIPLKKANVLLPFSGLARRIVEAVNALTPSLTKGLRERIDLDWYLLDDTTIRLKQLMIEAAIDTPWNIVTLGSGWFLSLINQPRAALDAFALYPSYRDSYYVRYAMLTTRAVWKGYATISQDLDQLRSDVINALFDEPNQPLLDYILLGIDALIGHPELALMGLDGLLARAEYLVEYAYHDLAFKALQDSEDFQRIVGDRYKPQITIDDAVMSGVTQPVSYDQANLTTNID